MRCILRTIAIPVLLAFVVMLTASASLAQYKVTTLTSNQPNVAPWMDTHLVNAWGLARGATSPWWVSDNVTGFSTLYNGSGVPQQLVVTIPAAPGNQTGSPSGIVFSGNGGFQVSENGNAGPSFFIFASNDGLITGWNPGVDLTHAIVAVDNSKGGSFYTGLAITNNSTGPNFIYAADAANNRVDIYDDSFVLVGSFTDPNLPATFAPYGIRDINHQLYVTFASTGSAAGGILDVFSETGGLIKRLVGVNGPLNQPWGIELAGANFGTFSNALLVSNNLAKGTIVALDPNTGKLLGKLTDQNGHIIQIDQIWGIAFGGGTTKNGQKNQLFFTAGPNGYGNGLFGRIQFVK